MAKQREGYAEGYIQHEVEADDGEVSCDECGTDLSVGDTYWDREDGIVCEHCFAEWRED